MGYFSFLLKLKKQTDLYSGRYCCRQALDPSGVDLLNVDFLGGQIIQPQVVDPAARDAQPAQVCLHDTGAVRCAFVGRQLAY